jgi:hypothetical protein
MFVSFFVPAPVLLCMAQRPTLDTFTGDEDMNARRISLVLVAVLLLAAFGGMPARAATSGFTGTCPWAGIYEDLGSYVTGGVVHYRFFSVFSMSTTDSRFNGSLTMTMDSVYPTTRPVMWGPAQGTWTLDTDGDGQPDWQGPMTIAANAYTHNQVNAHGVGLGKYAGLRVSFTALANPETIGVVGRIIGD